MRTSPPFDKFYRLEIHDSVKQDLTGAALSIEP